MRLISKAAIAIVMTLLSTTGISREIIGNQLDLSIGGFTSQESPFGSNNETTFRFKFSLSDQSSFSGGYSLRYRSAKESDASTNTGLASWFVGAHYNTVPASIGTIQTQTVLTTSLFFSEFEVVVTPSGDNTSSLPKEVYSANSIQMEGSQLFRMNNLYGSANLRANIWSQYPDSIVRKFEASFLTGVILPIQFRLNAEVLSDLMLSEFGIKFGLGYSW